MLPKRQPVSYFADEKYNGQKGRKLVEDILGGESDFPFPKSVHSVIDCIDLFLPKDGIVLDFFAGSGTTGHATLMLNDRDGGSRQFILCTNNENNIARDDCYERIKRIIYIL